MSNGSSNKKVAKAASAGGGSLSRRARSSSSSFNATIIGVCIAGIALVVGSVIGRTVLESPPYSATSKKVKSALSDLQKLQKQKNPNAKKLATALQKYNELNGQTHVHSAYGIWNCDKYVAPFDASQLEDPLGVHAHDDGLLHIHPFTNRGAGKNARLNLFFDATKMTLTTKKLSWVADPTGAKLNTLEVNKNKCNGKKAEIWMLYWEKAVGKNVTKTPQKYLDDFGNVRLTGDSAFAFVFAPKGTKIPEPPSTKAIETPGDVASPTGATPTNTVVEVTPTTVPGAATTTVAGTVTTAVGAATTLAKAATTVAGAATTTPPSTTTGATQTTLGAKTLTSTAAPTTIAG